MTIPDIARQAGFDGTVEWTVLCSKRPGRSLWHIRAVGGMSGTKSAYVKQYESAERHQREARALRQMPPGTAPSMLASVSEPPTLVLAEIDGVPLDGPSFRPEWLEGALKTVVAAVGLPGPWPDDPPPRLDPVHELFAADLAVRAPSAGSALQQTVNHPLRVPCHGDISPANLIVASRAPARVVLLDYEFYGPGDPLADLSALCLTPSLTLADSERLGLLRHGCELIERKTGQPLAGRMIGAIALWAVQCAAWHRRQNSDTSRLEQETLNNAAVAITALTGGDT